MQYQVKNPEQNLEGLIEVFGKVGERSLIEELYIENKRDFEKTFEACSQIYGQVDFPDHYLADSDDYGEEIYEYQEEEAKMPKDPPAEHRKVFY